MSGDSSIFWAYPATGSHTKSFIPPPNALVYVDSPRTLEDIPAKVAANYCFALVAYAHYLSLTRLSNKYTLEAIQLVAFALFPLLPVVQLGMNASRTLLKILENGVQTDWHYYVGCLLGCYARTVTHETSGAVEPSDFIPLVEVDPSLLAPTRPPVETRESKDWKPVGRLNIILLNMLAVMLASVAYVRRVQLMFYNWTFCAVLGVDHRVGWVDLGGLSAVVLSLVTWFLGQNWEIRTLPRPRPSWSTELSKSRVGQACIEIAIAGLVQDMLVLVTNRYSALLLLKLSLHKVRFWLVAILIAYALFRLRRTVRSRLSMVTSVYILLAACTIPTAILQVAYDVAEMREVQRGVFWPWNFRWAEGDQLVLGWWVI